MSALRGLLDDALDAPEVRSQLATVELRRRPEPMADIRLIFRRRGWLESPAGRKLQDSLSLRSEVASLRRARSAVALRLTNDFILTLGRRLSEGAVEELRSNVAAGGPGVVIGFIGPNTCKALHVGHLRNILLGEALASALTAAGANVRRQSLEGDIGRNVCESMAGYARCFAGASPDDAQQKPDHFVGACYGSYSGSRAAGQPADPNAGEAEPSGDEADRIMGRWLRGDGETLALWRRMHAWVVSGHTETLGRLGVVLSDVDHESAGVPPALTMAEEGLRRGVFQHAAGDAVVFSTGRPNYPHLVLVRRDGFPTEHGRLLGVYDRLLDEYYPHWRYVELAGVEWEPSARVLGAALSALRPGPRNTHHVRLFHGMVHAGDGQVTSRRGEPLLVDDLVDRLERHPSVTALAEKGGDASPQTVADIVLRAYFLQRALRKPLAFAWDDLLDERRSPGWAIARVSCRARDARVGEPDPGDGAYRAAILSAHRLPGHLENVANNYDLSGLTRFVSEYALQAPDAPAAGSVARPVLAAALGFLGYQIDRTPPR